MTRRRAGYLLLEDGVRFVGDDLRGSTPVLAEAVFNTSHSGYQEILSDPSYSRQMVVFTAPHVGNVGVNGEDLESRSVRAAAALVRALAPRPSSWRAHASLTDWLGEAGVPLLSGIDTRAVTLHLREAGAMRAGIFSADVDPREALEAVRASPSMAGADLASVVSRAEPLELGPEAGRDAFRLRTREGEGLHVALLDLGVKRSIVDELLCRGCRVTLLPAVTPAEALLDDERFDGVLLSNGPGDPAATLGPLSTVRQVLDASIARDIPVFGICLGHQLLSLAAGLETYKLRFGHRGANHPVRRESDGRVEITSQNHGFAVRPEGLGRGFRATHVNLNDGTIEGIEHESAPLFSIQYHPEASPGPLEGREYFDRFVSMMRVRRRGSGRGQ